MEAIKFGDQPPEVGVRVLFWTQVDEWYIGKLLDGGTHWLPDECGFGVKCSERLFWMPLPNPPSVADFTAAATPLTSPQPPA